jgi:hypothetical protein
VHENVSNAEGRPCLIILEGLINEVYSKEVYHIFTKGSHHWNIRVILITQNRFDQGLYCRDISLQREVLGTLGQESVEGIDKEYGIRRDCGTFMTGNSTVSVDDTCDITIRGKQFKGTKSMLGLLTRKKANSDLTTTNDMKRYKNILQMTNPEMTFRSVKNRNPLR